MQFKTYKIPLYLGEFTIFYVEYGETKFALAKIGLNPDDHFPDLDPKKNDAFAFSHPSPSGYSRYFIFLNKNTKRISPGVIAHECKHVVNFIFNDRRIQLQIGNDEPECYLLSWLVNKVHEFYGKVG